jgi:hypothetical protein
MQITIAGAARYLRDAQHADGARVSRGCDDGA